MEVFQKLINTNGIYVENPKTGISTASLEINITLKGPYIFYASAHLLQINNISNIPTSCFSV